MKNVLVIGSTGQIGSELTMKLRREIPGSTVVAGYIPGAEPKGELLESGPAEIADVRDAAALAAIVGKYQIDTVYNLAALLSAVAERKPLLAWDIQMNGLLNILEVAREKGVAVFTPSSIGSFGPETPHVGTPQDTIQRPRSMYGVTKVATELHVPETDHRRRERTGRKERLRQASLAGGVAPDEGKLFSPAYGERERQGFTGSK